MVDLSEIQAAYYMVAATGVLVAAIYYVYNMKVSQGNMRANLDTRQAQLFMGINQYANTKEWMKANRMIFFSNLKLEEVQDFEKMHAEPDLYDAFYHVAGFYEGLGVLIRENLIDVKLVAELSSGNILSWWARFGPGVLKCRKAWDFPRYAVEIEYLAKRVEECAREHPEMGIRIPNNMIHA